VTGPAPPPPTDALAVAAHLVAWVILERPDGRILLARRSGVVHGDGRWGLPGGHAHRDESWTAAALRETREEVGVKVTARDLVPVGIQRYLDATHHGIDVFFRARTWSGRPRAVSECSEVGWFEPSFLPDDALDWLAPTLAMHLTRGEWFGETGFHPPTLPCS
jgi:8-oxo-dGTP diphosphatase